MITFNAQSNLIGQAYALGLQNMATINDKENNCLLQLHTAIAHIKDELLKEVDTLCAANNNHMSPKIQLTINRLHHTLDATLDTLINAMEVN